MRILHDGQDALTVFPSSSESVEEITQSVFMQGTRHQNPRHDGKKQCDAIGEDVASEIDDGRHGTSCEPAC